MGKLEAILKRMIACMLRRSLCCSIFVSQADDGISSAYYGRVQVSEKGANTAKVCREAFGPSISACSLRVALATSSLAFSISLASGGTGDVDGESTRKEGNGSCCERRYCAILLVLSAIILLRFSIVSSCFGPAERIETSEAMV